MSEILYVLLVGGVAQTVTLALVLLAFEAWRTKRLRKQPGTIEHLTSEIKRVEAESRARDEMLRRELRETMDLIEAHDEELIRRYTRELFDKFSERMYQNAEGRVLGKGTT